MHMTIDARLRPGWVRPRSTLWLCLGLVFIFPGCANNDICSPHLARTSGYQAAAAGQPATASAVDEQCHDLWLQGWNDFQQEHCAVTQAWAAALAGESGVEACLAQTNLAAGYLAAYRLGEQLLALQQEREQLIDSAEPAAGRLRVLEHEIRELRALAQQQGLLPLSAVAPPAAADESPPQGDAHKQ
ncbi:MAG: hypothetical protein Tsb002_19490 [Wenzhouxiangellaceae bacterium]